MADASSKSQAMPERPSLRDKSRGPVVWGVIMVGISVLFGIQGAPYYGQAASIFLSGLNFR